jgi:hypothetical protein
MSFSPNYSKRRVYWLSQETTSIGLPSVTNTAGSLDLATTGTVMCARSSRGETLIFTTADLWVMTYIGAPLVHAVRQAGNHCGIISPRAAVVIDAGAFWMGYDKFFMYDGFVKTLPCEVAEYVFGDFNRSAAPTVWALVNQKFNEVTWFYPSTGAPTPDRYVTFNVVEQHWTFGQFGRAAGVPFQPLATTPVPVMISATRAVYDHETGTDHGGAVPYIGSGVLEIGDGDNVVQVQSIIPDDKTVGDVTASLYTAMYPDEAEVVNGPYTLTKRKSIRVTFRQVRLYLTEASASAWRVGVVRLGAVLGGRR